jgi:hypothetical protein
MHKNERFNILQADGNCNPNFVVIDGKRLPSGHAEFGAKVVSTEMPRDAAISLADKLQANHDALVLNSEVTIEIGVKNSYIAKCPVPDNCTTHYADGWTFADWYLNDGGDPNAESPDGWHQEKYEGWWDRMNLARSSNAL